MRRKNQTRLMEQWNRKYPTETLVVYHPAIGEEKTDGNEYLTQSDAHMMCGTAVVWLHGFSGCVAVEALEPVRVAKG